MLGEFSLSIVISHNSLNCIIKPSSNYSNIFSFCYVSLRDGHQQSGSPLQYHKEEIGFLLITKIGRNLLHNYGIYNYLQGRGKW